MTPVLEDAVLGTDLDCQNFDLRNISLMVPVPDNLLSNGDPRLTDGRTAPPGSVTNDTVTWYAGIEQSKLNLGGDMPTDWIGTGSSQASPGDAVERMSSKNAPNGYAGLDSSGRLAADTPTLPDVPEAGTVTSVGIHMPVDFEFPTDGSPVTTHGTLAVHWNAAPNNSWFGVVGPIPPQNHVIPTFKTRVLVHEMVPDLNAAKFTSGTFPIERLPFAVGVGANHAKGMLRDPGATANPDSYLARDLIWRVFHVQLAYQPVVPDVTIELTSWFLGPIATGINKANIIIRSWLKGSFLFYRVTPNQGTPGRFKQARNDKTPDDPHIRLEVTDYDFVEAYASKSGYRNSDIESWQVITPITNP